MGKRGVFVPYVEVDSYIENNSYQSLQGVNPYILLRDLEYMSVPNTAVYNLRAGFTGHTVNNKFSYRLYANVASMSDALYWVNVDNIGFDVITDSQNIISLNASVEYKPFSSLLLGAGFKGMYYDNGADVESGKPAFLADFAVRYTHRKFAIGATAEAMGSRSWTFIDTTAANGGGISSHKYPACVDLGLTFDWFVAKQCTVYVEGRNLANAKIYDWALYRRLGAGAVVGIKVQF